MLTLYRRHLAECSHARDRFYKRCRTCPMWIQGVVDGRSIRRSLKTASWERAEELKRQIEDRARPAIDEPPITIEEALSRFLADCQARNLNYSTLNKYRHLNRELLSFSKKNGYRTLRELDARAARDFRNSWKLGPGTSAKELERLRAFFRYSVDSDLIEKNPAKTIRPPIVKSRPREPFSETDQAKMLLWSNHPTWSAPEEKQNVLAPHPKTPIFLKLLLFSALRITDAATLEKDRIQDGKLFLYAAKNGRPVRVPLPPDLVKDLEAIPGPELFHSPQGSRSPQTVSDYWRDQIKKVFEYLGIKNPHPHRFRHTLAVNMLNHGSSVEDVAAVLGNSPAIVTLHYAPWVESRQDRISEQIRKTWTQPAKLLRVK